MDQQDFSLYVGYLLTEKEAMEIWGAKYEPKIYTKCPKDKVPNLNKHNFCNRCGTDLRYQKIKNKGIESVGEIEDLAKIKKARLDVEVLENDEVVIGKCIADSSNMTEDAIAIDRTNLQTTIEALELALPKVIGIERPVTLYFLAYTH